MASVFRYLMVLGCILSVAPVAQAQNEELSAAIGCVITAWNAYDVNAARDCYDESAVAIRGGKPQAMDWELERRLREFDAAARSRFRFEVLEARDSTVEFTLYETNLLIEALGLQRVTAHWRYTVRGGRVVAEELLNGDSRFSALLRDFTRWGRERRPAGWANVSNSAGNIRFDGPSTPALVELAREWSRYRRSLPP